MATGRRYGGEDSHRLGIIEAAVGEATLYGPRDRTQGSGCVERSSHSRLSYQQLVMILN
jgi:hypothetical protein